MARLRPGQAANPAPPTVSRVRIRFAKRGRLRFLSHRDVARSFERAVRRAGVPVAHSHGFHPHPRLSWIGAAPTGTASEAEYLEVGLTAPVEPRVLAEALDAALPEGLDVLGAVVADTGGGAARSTPLAERIDASRWEVELPGVAGPPLRSALSQLLAEESVIVERVTPSGRRMIDVRAALVAADVRDRPSTGTAPSGGASASTAETGQDCAILTAVVRQTTPAVRPDDVLGALDVVAGFRPPAPAKATRMAQGLLDHRGDLVDPFAEDRATATG